MLAELVRLQGGEPLFFPLLEIIGMDDYVAFDAIMADIDGFDWAIFISSNAVQHGMARLLSQRALPAGLKWAAIGPMTARELQSHGIEQVLTPDQRFDSESLLKLPEMKSVKGKRFVIFRGVGGRDVLASELIKRGAQVVFAECYRRINPPLDITLMHSLWQNDRLHAIVVTSSEALRHFIQYAKANSWLSSIPLFVNHARIAETALEQGIQHVIQAQDVGDGGMLKAILDWREVRK